MSWLDYERGVIRTGTGIFNNKGEELRPFDEIRGIGPAFRGHLSRCAIDSLAQLARLSEDELKRELVIRHPHLRKVIRLFDLASWISQAQEKTGNREDVEATQPLTLPQQVEAVAA